MTLVFNRRLAIPLWAVASIVVALTAPSVTLSLMVILGMAMIGFTIPGLVPWLRAVPAVARGRWFDAGLGIARRAGEYRVSGTLLFHREQYDAPLDPRDSSKTSRNDVSLIAAADRSFARERYNVRVFGVYNASESSGFARGIAAATLRDNVALEGSLGWFLGGGRDLVGQFDDRDFLYVRLKYYF